MGKKKTDKGSKTKASSKAKKESKPVEEVKVELVEEPKVEAVEAEAASNEPTLSDDFGAFMGKLQQVNSLLSGLRSEFRGLEKRATRELRVAVKAGAKRKRKTGNRSPSGFVKPTLISTELATFLGKEHGTEMARTEVTREINAYIRKHSLQDKDNGRKINPDSALQKLLKLKKSDELTYFNLQRYMSPHFAKGGQAPLAGST